MGAVKQTVKTAIPALIAGGLLGVLDVKLLTNYSPMVRIGAKVAAAAVAGVALRRSPNSAYAAMGAILGSLGYEQAAKLAGGAVVVAGNTTTAAKGLSALIREDPAAMGPVVDDMRGMGLLVEAPGMGAPNGVQDQSFFG